MGAQLDLALPGARRVACRVCAGSCTVPGPYAWSAPVKCAFCVDGVARFVCTTCGEALPLCPCFGELRGVVPPASPPVTTTATKGRRR